MSYLDTLNGGVLALCIYKAIIQYRDHINDHSSIVLRGSQFAYRQFFFSVCFSVFLGGRVWQEELGYRDLFGRRPYILFYTGPLDNDTFTLLEWHCSPTKSTIFKTFALKNNCF